MMWDVTAKSQFRSVVLTCWYRCLTEVIQKSWSVKSYKLINRAIIFVCTFLCVKSVYVYLYSMCVLLWFAMEIVFIQNHFVIN